MQTGPRAYCIFRPHVARHVSAYNRFYIAAVTSL